jgi:hypothetical protein
MGKKGQHHCDAKDDFHGVFFCFSITSCCALSDHLHIWRGVPFWANHVVLGLAIYITDISA